MRRPSHPARNVITVAVAALFLASCAGGQPAEPDKYGEINTENDGYYGNLMFGCTGVEANDQGEYVDVTLEDPDFCTCVFRGMKATVPFPDAKEFDEQQADAEDGETIELPEGIDKVRVACADDDGAYS